MPKDTPCAPSLPSNQGSPYLNSVQPGQGTSAGRWQNTGSRGQGSSGSVATGTRAPQSFQELPSFEHSQSFQVFYTASISFQSVLMRSRVKCQYGKSIYKHYSRVGCFFVCRGKETIVIGGRKVVLKRQKKGW